MTRLFKLFRTAELHGNKLLPRSASLSWSCSSSVTASDGSPTSGSSRRPAGKRLAYTVKKKVSDIPVLSRDVTHQNYADEFSFSEALFPTMAHLNITYSSIIFINQGRLTEWPNWIQYITYLSHLATVFNREECFV
jgi:hypothetical protein